MPEILSERFDEAFRFAHRLHRQQKRKGTAIPYISHLMTVAALVIEHGGDEDQAIAALLHDVAEDQGGAATLADVRTLFGPAVADIVSDCTDAWEEPKPEWRSRKEAYLAALPGKPERSLLVSLADKTHNAEAILFDYQTLGDELWGRFNGGDRALVGTTMHLPNFFQIPCRVHCRIGSREPCLISVETRSSFIRKRKQRLHHKNSQPYLCY